MAGTRTLQLSHLDQTCAPAACTGTRQRCTARRTSRQFGTSPPNERTHRSATSTGCGSYEQADDLTTSVEIAKDTATATATASAHGCGAFTVLI